MLRLVVPHNENLVPGSALRTLDVPSRSNRRCGRSINERSSRGWNFKNSQKRVGRCNVRNRNVRVRTRTSSKRNCQALKLGEDVRKFVFSAEKQVKIRFEFNQLGSRI